MRPGTCHGSSVPVPDDERSRAELAAQEAAAQQVDVAAVFSEESWHGPLGHAVREGLEQARRGEGIDLDELA